MAKKKFPQRQKFCHCGAGKIIIDCAASLRGHSKGSMHSEGPIRRSLAAVPMAPIRTQETFKVKEELKMPIDENCSETSRKISYLSFGSFDRCILPQIFISYVLLDIFRTFSTTVHGPLGISFAYDIRSERWREHKMEDPPPTTKRKRTKSARNLRRHRKAQGHPASSPGSTPETPLRQWRVGRTNICPASSYSW